MKLIILLTLLLLSLNSFAQHKVTIIKSGEAKLEFEKSTLNKAVKQLKKLILSKKRFKGEWSEDSAGNIFKRERSRQVPNGLFVEEEVWSEELGATETIAFPQYDTEVFDQFYKPTNFSVLVEDITAQKAQEESDKQADKTLRQQIKQMNFSKKQNESVAEWRVRIAKGMNRFKRLLQD